MRMIIIHALRCGGGFLVSTCRQLDLARQAKIQLVTDDEHLRAPSGKQVVACPHKIWYYKCDIFQHDAAGRS